MVGRARCGVGLWALGCSKRSGGPVLPALERLLVRAAIPILEACEVPEVKVQ